MEFIRLKLLEWLECLSLLDMLPFAAKSLKILAVLAGDNNPILKRIVYDANRFLLHHYPTISTWPLQIYSSGIVFSPETSVARAKNNLEKVPVWLRRLPRGPTAWDPLVQTLQGHSGSITAVASSPDGKKIASASEDHTAILWNTEIGSEHRALTGHTGSLTALSFSPDSQQIITASKDRTVRLWDVSTGSTLNTFECYASSVTALSFFPDGKKVILGFHDRTVWLWDLITDTCEISPSIHLEPVNAVTLCADGSQVASVCNAMELWRWDMKSDPDSPDWPDYEVVDSLFHGFPHQIAIMKFSPDGLFLAYEEPLGRITIWNTELRELTVTLTDEYGLFQINISPIQSISSSILSGWQISRIGLRNRIHQDMGREVSCVGIYRQAVKSYLSQDVQGRRTVWHFPADGTLIASATSFGVYLWDAATGTLQRNLDRLDIFISYRTVSFSADGKKIAAASNYELREYHDLPSTGISKVSILAFIQFWDVTTGVRQIRAEGSLQSFTALVFSRDGKQLASGSSNGTIELWDVANGRPIKEFSGHSGSVTTIAFSSDGKMIASAGADLTLRLWEIDSVLDSIPLVRKVFVGLLHLNGKCMFDLPERVRTLRFSPDNMQLWTDLGCVELGASPAIQSNINSGLPVHLFVRDGWICYRSLRILKFPSGYVNSSFDVWGNRMAVNFTNGELLIFECDCGLLSTLMLSQ
ncbi:hypothetical protein N7520_003434 [Penicillium odoratum]|uniref:uncharacterized protein n=1 Tax=Penicillium odoratum TaxID=1167516 RepID=UPI002546CE1F|nr:uncharacterized protein N7520_003434 [Penicillium odoratum]KAJ5768875.1 hypothetical protein N7520_003434 [Penicillium odoratum]